MADLILRGRITEDDMIELLEPLLAHVDRAQEVKIILEDAEYIYETINEYGDPVLVDEANGLVMPVNPLTREEFLNSPLIGLWKDRRDEIGDSAEWIRKQR